jgi:hypothetical protein
VIRCDTERAANNFRRGALAESDSFIESIVLIPVAIDFGIAGLDMLGRDRRGVDRSNSLANVVPDGMGFQGSGHSIYSISESSSCQESREPLLLFCREIGVDLRSVVDHRAHRGAGEGIALGAMGWGAIY